MSETSLLVTPREAAALLSVSKAGLYRLIGRHASFPAPVRLGPKTVRWRRSDLEGWVNRTLTMTGTTPDALAKMPVSA
jgi:excisionase family DNA binding protein